MYEGLQAISVQLKQYGFHLKHWLSISVLQPKILVAMVENKRNRRSSETLFYLRICS